MAGAKLRREAKFFALSIILLNLLLFETVAHAGQAPNLSQLFIEIDQFRADGEALKYRHNFIKHLDKLEKILKSYPSHPKRQYLMWTQAALLEDMWSITRSDSDRSAVVSAFQKIIQDDEKSIFGQGAQKKLAEMGVAVEVMERKQSRKAPKNEIVVTRVNPPVKAVSGGISVFPAGKAAVNVQGFDRSGKGLLRFDFPGSVNFKHGLIPQSADHPKRLFIDVSGVTLPENKVGDLGISVPGVMRVRSGQHDPSTARFVLDLSGDSKAYIFENQDRQGFEITISADATYVAEAPSVRDKAPNVDASEPMDVNRFLYKKIVIDPGHGGQDPGAIGKSGLQEKDVTLKISKRVQELLKQQVPNVKVYLTREEDKSLPLAKRTQMANELEADLFISIHVNSSPNRHTKGVETYYLDTAHDRYAKRLAARENAVDESGVSDLEFILADMNMKSNTTDSVHLGNVMQTSIVNQMGKKYEGVESLGLKNALFYVLLGAKMPAVLIETAFISNRLEERRLKQRQYIDQMAMGIVKGMRRFIEEKQAVLIR